MQILLKTIAQAINHPALDKPPEKQSFVSKKGAEKQHGEGLGLHCCRGFRPFSLSFWCLSERLFCFLLMLRYYQRLMRHWG